MKRRFVFAALGCFLLGSVMLSACSSPVSQPVIPEVIQVQQVEKNENRISLVSSETVEVVPDMAELQVTIRTENKNAAKCQQENTENLNLLLEYLKGEGVADESIKTSGFSLNPRYDWSGNTQKLVGYDMRTTVTITDVPVDGLGAMLTEVVENGANEIDSVSYFSSQYDQAYNQALARAIELSKSKGEALAAASGAKLGPVVKIQEMSDNQYGRYVNADLRVEKNMAMAAATEDAVAMDVMPGEMQVTAEITVEFELYH